MNNLQKYPAYETHMNYLQKTYEQIANDQQTTYKCLMQMAYKPLINYLRSTYELIVNYLQISYELLMNSS